MRLVTPHLALACVIACMSPGPCAAEEGPGADIAAAGELASKLGQLFIVNVDGFGYSGPLCVSPAYVELVERLQVGGVIPHYGTSDFQRIRDANRVLAKSTRLPLLVCADIVSVQAPDPVHAGKISRFGDGYVGGFIGKFAVLSDRDFAALSVLNAFMFASLGINTALGPTVDDSTADPRTVERARVVVDALRRFGIEPVLKHFPFLPAYANLHRDSPDTKTPVPEMKRRISIFRRMLGESDLVMTTHTFDSLVDAEAVATLSPVWNRIIRRGIGFSGLLMSDDLLMLQNYADRRALGSGEAGGTAAKWAERAILSGHDFIILAGSAYTTYSVFDGLLRAASADTASGRALRRRIEEAHARISRFKESHGQSLTRSFDASSDEIRAVVEAVPQDPVAGDLRIDPDILARLEDAFKRASAGASVSERFGTVIRRFFMRMLGRD